MAGVDAANRSRVAGIVLAAGTSGRMGTLKPLLPFGDRPMIARVIESLRAAGGIEPIFVVTGHRASEVAVAVAPYKVTPIHNADFAAGEMLSSIRAGIAAFAPDVGGFLLALADQPAVAAATIETLQRRWHASMAPLVIPTFGNKRGHPLLISATLIPEILSLSGDQTLRDVVHRHLAEAAEVPVDDPAVIADVDTPADYAAALARWQSANCA